MFAGKKPAWLSLIDAGAAFVVTVTNAAARVVLQMPPLDTSDLAAIR
jgi:hypothetical protein